MILDATFAENNQSLLGDFGVVSSVGISNPFAVKYIQQSLTEEQKVQARANIGVEEAVFEMLVGFGIAPVLLDENGAVLADGNNAVLINK